MNSDTALHVALGTTALFVGTFQLVLRWQWSDYLVLEDRWALRFWACSTALTSCVIAASMYYFRHVEVNHWFWLVAVVVLAKMIATVQSYRALKSWWHRSDEKNHHQHRRLIRRLPQ